MRSYSSERVAPRCPDGSVFQPSGGQDPVPPIASAKPSRLGNVLDATQQSAWRALTGSTVCRRHLRYATGMLPRCMAVATRSTSIRLLRIKRWHLLALEDAAARPLISFRNCFRLIYPGPLRRGQLNPLRSSLPMSVG